VQRLSKQQTHDPAAVALRIKDVYFYWDANIFNDAYQPAAQAREYLAIARGSLASAAGWYPTFQL